MLERLVFDKMQMSGLLHTQYRITGIIGLVVWLSSIHVAISAQSRTCESSYTGGTEFEEPPGCSFAGEKFRYCTDGKRKIDRCIEDKNREFCVFCKVGLTYSLDNNNCTECLPCTACREDEIVVERCTVRSDTVCRCRPCPTQSPVTADPRTFAVTDYQYDCPTCPECDIECPTCPTCPTFNQSCPTVSPTQNCSISCLDSKDQRILSFPVEVFLLCVVFLLVVVICIACACIYKKWNTQNIQNDPEKNKLQNGKEDSKSYEKNEKDVEMDTKLTHNAGEDNRSPDTDELNSGNDERSVSKDEKKPLLSPDGGEDNRSPDTDELNGGNDERSVSKDEKKPLLSPDGESSTDDDNSVIEDLEHDAVPDEPSKKILKKNHKKSVNHKKILDQNCQKHKLKIRENVEDYGEPGNCFFDATFDQLKRLNLQEEIDKYKTAVDLRRSLCDYMREHPEIKINNETIEGKYWVYKDNAAVDKNILWEDYLVKMEDPKTWAGDLEVKYMHRMLNRTIEIIMSSGEDHPDRCVTGDETERHAMILLGHEYELHYMSLEPINKHGTSQQVTSVISPIVSGKEEDNSEMRNMNEKATQRDFGDIIRQLGADDLQELFFALGISPANIDKDEREADSTDVNIKARRVLTNWRKRNGSKATCQAILDALEQSGNRLAKEIIEYNYWNGKDKQVTTDSELYSEIGGLDTSYLRQLFEELGISEDEVKKLELKENSKDFDRLAKAVLRLWKKRNGIEKATVQSLRDAIKQVKKKKRKDLPKRQLSKQSDSTSIDSAPSSLTGELNIDFLFDDNNGQTALDIADAIIAILNSSKGGSIKLTNNKEAISPSLSFTTAFEQIMKDLDLIEPIDLILPSFDFSEHSEQTIRIHRSKKKILYMCKDGVGSGMIDSWKAKWGMAYVKSPSSIKVIENTNNLLRIFGEDYHQDQNVPAIPGAKRLKEDEQLTFAEEKNRIYFVESISNLEIQITEILKYVSAFANTNGGLIALGIAENGTVNGIKFQDIDAAYNADIVRGVIFDRIHKDLIWMQNEKSEIKVLTGQHIDSNYVEYKSCNVKRKKVATDKKVVFIKVHRLTNGVVFTSVPQCPYFYEKLHRVKFTGEGLDDWCRLARTCLQETFPR